MEEFQNNDFIIKFDKNTELLRLIQANFSYDSRILKCLFQYKNIENQIIDRYLRSKSLIDTSTIPVFEYSDEINDEMSLFKRLEESNKQVN